MATSRARIALVLTVTLLAAGCTSLVENVSNQLRGDVGNEWAHSMTQVDKLQEQGLTGKGVNVAVVDTGVGIEHREFPQLDPSWKDFVNGQQDPYDDGRHGTHVTGLAVAQTDQSSNPDIEGVAPGANLLHAKAIEGGGTGDSSDVADAIDWSVRNGADVLVLSLGGQPSALPIGNAVEDSVKRATDAGVVVVAAAGNEYGGSNDECNGVASPASQKRVIAVGAVNRTGSIAPFSCDGDQRGSALPTDDRDHPHKKPEVTAPGVQLIGPWPGRPCVDQQQAQYCLFSGTSQATPIVGGIVALILEDNPELKRQGTGAIDQIKNALMNTANEQGFSGHHDRYGYGIVQGQDALDALN
jgi:serine protease AprX